jgi:uncharacterized protein
VHIELRPFGVNCNIACQYCYQNPQRDAGNLTKNYSIEAMKQAVEAENRAFFLFGGEPLLIPEADLEDLWKWGLEKFGTNGIQTNGTLINDNHIRMFRDYKVAIGISMDGPGSLNDVRWAGTLEKTRKLTQKTETAIERLVSEGLNPGIIVTIHKNNASKEKLPVMHDWFRYLDKLGIKGINIHILESDNKFIHDKYALSDIENIEALLSFARLETELKNLSFDLFRDMEKLLIADDKGVGCIWGACDPYTTVSVRGVEGNGQRSNCGRSNKDGINFVKAEKVGHERYLALYYTPQEYGGCNGCRFFLTCKGQCPGTSMNSDWRNKTEYCGVWLNLFEEMESRLVKRGITPISLAENRQELEKRMIASWERGLNPNLNTLIDMQAAFTANILH